MSPTRQFLLLLIISIFSFSSCLAAASEDITNIFDSFRQGYDKRVRPNYGGKPVEVGVSIYVLYISSLSDNYMDLTMDIYFRQTWNDPRLKFQGPAGVNEISAGTDFLRTIWVPDTFFPNEKKTYFHTATISNEFVKISKQGDVLRSFRITVTTACPMDLRYFPMDRQLCSLEIESFGSNASDIRYKWAKGDQSVGVGSDVSLPEFRVLGYNQIAMEINVNKANYSRLACEIFFARSWGYHLLQTYLPAIFLVVLSWVSFWIHRNATVARVLIGLASTLSMILLMWLTNASLPKISYYKAIDIYLWSCLITAFASLLQFATVGYVNKQKEMLRNSDGEMGENDDAEMQRLKLLNKKMFDLSPAPSSLDKYSRIAFPVCFIIFNLMYWIIYLHLSNIVIPDLTPIE